MRTSWWLAVLAGVGFGAWLISRADRSQLGISVALDPYRQKMLTTAHISASLKTPYQWGGGRSSTDYGVDCSGLVLQAMRYAGIPDPKQGWTADAFWNAFDPVAAPEAGDLAFYGTDKATHVVIIDEVLPGDTETMIIGANGGGPNVLTSADAASANAYVRRDRLMYRKDLLGFRTLAKYVEETKT